MIEVHAKKRKQTNIIGRSHYLRKYICFADFRKNSSRRGILDMHIFMI